MKTFQPQVRLVKKINMDTPDEYFLHAVTCCDRTKYRAAGHSPVPSILDNDGILQIELQIGVDTSDPNLKLHSHVSHTIPLGYLPTNETAIPIQVNILKNTPEEGVKPGGSVTVSSASASEDDRPMA